MIFLDDSDIQSASPDDLRKARSDAETMRCRLLGAYTCGVIHSEYEPHVVHSILELFADMPSRPQYFVDALGDAMEALAEPYDPTTESKVERAYNLAARQQVLCTTELMRRREPIDLAASKFIF